VGLVVAAVLVCGGLVAAVAVRQSRDALRDAILADNRATALLASEYVDRAVDGAQIGVRGLASRLSMQFPLDARRDSVEGQLNALLRAAPLLDSAAVYDATGTLLASTIPDNPNAGQSGPVADRDWFQDALTTRAPYLAQPTVARATGRAVVPYSAPVLGPDGSVQAIVVGGISVMKLAGAIPSDALGPRPRVIIIDFADGEHGPIVLSHPDPARVLQSGGEQNAAVSRLAAGERGAQETVTSAGERMLASFAPVPRLRWGVVIQEPVDLALAPVDALMRQMITVMGVGTLTVAILAALAALGLRRPILHLRDASLALAAGDFTRRSGLKRRDEIGDLGRSFDAMADGLAAREAALRESQERYRAVVEQSADGIVIAADSTFVFANTATAQIVGLDSASELLGQSITSFVVPEDQSRLLETARARQRGEAAPSRYELRIRRADGALRSIELAATAISHQGQPASLAVIRDVTERRQAQEEVLEINWRLRAALEQLEAAQQQVVQQERLRALGEMASGIAHDLNNVLAPVVGFSELLLIHPDNLKDQHKLRRYLELIATGAQDASAVVKRLREFYRARDVEDAFAVIDLPSLVEQVVALTQPKWKGQAQAEGRTISVCTELVSVPPIAGSETQLREALTNLVFNAVDAMPRGGTVSLRTRLLGQSVALEVSDTGMGMTEEVRRKCLEPFFSTKGDRGTGLGLAMVHGIVQRHNGLLEITSVPGQGSTFTLLLPVPLPDPAPEQSPAGEKAAGAARRLRVLVVDDEPVVRQVTSAYLAADGHAVVAAGGGKEALAQFVAAAREAGGEGGSFDLVVTDRAMPDMSGDQLAAAIKRYSPATPVLLLTGFADLMNGERPEGVDAVLRKPATIASLRQTVLALLSSPLVPATATTT
jgi:PAS domain S-box-containing protein